MAAVRYADPRCGARPERIPELRDDAHLKRWVGNQRPRPRSIQGRAGIDQGKPGATRGRKATGLARQSAGLPMCRGTSRRQQEVERIAMKRAMKHASGAVLEGSLVALL